MTAELDTPRPVWWNHPLVDSLVPPFQHDNFDSRLQLVQVLSELLDDEAVEVLSEALWMDWLSDVRDLAAEALTTLPPDRALPCLAKGLLRGVNSSTDVIARCMSQIGESAALEHIAPYLQHPDDKVRTAAVEVLSTFTDPGSVRLLTEVLFDVHYGPAAMARFALQARPVSVTLGPLLDACRADDSPVLLAVAELLIAERDPAVLPSLTAALRDEAPGLRFVAARVLAQMPNTEAALLTVVNDPDARVREHAVMGLGATQDPGFATVFVTCLNDEVARVRFAAAEALGRCGAVFAIPALVEALRDEEEGVRVAAVSAIGMIGDASVVPRLQAMRNDDSRIVRSCVRDALRELAARS